MAIDKFLYLFNFFPVKSSCALVTWEKMVISTQARSCPGRNDLAQGEFTISSQITSAHDDFTEKFVWRAF